MSSVLRLLELVKPADREGLNVDWGSLEGRLGYVLPDDYKRIAELYGSGSFGELIVNIPSEFELWAQRGRELIGSMLDEGLVDVPYHVNELVAWGRSNDADVLFWDITASRDPNEWTVVMWPRHSPLWGITSLTLAEFLVEVAENRSAIEDLLPEVPGGKLSFRAWELGEGHA